MLALSWNIFEKVDSILFNLEFSVSVIYFLKIFIVWKYIKIIYFFIFDINILKL